MTSAIGHDPDSYIREHGPEALAAILGVEFAPEPVPKIDPWRLNWVRRCDRAAMARLRERSSSGELAADMLALDAIARRKEAAAFSASLARIEAERARRPQGDEGDVSARASAYLATLPDANGNDAWNATIKIVCGWALDEDAALEMLWAEYVPRYHRKIARGELAGMVRRAGRSTRCGRGWLRANRERQ